MTPADKASLTRVHDRLFAHRRYGTAIHGPDTELDGATERALVGDFSTLEAYWANPEPFEAERRRGQAQIDALFVAHEANVLKQMQDIWDREGQ